MKKKFYIIILVIALLAILTIGYWINYKNVEQIKELLEKGQTITNMYIERYTNAGEYINNIKDYKANIYVKDNVYIYEVLGQIDYVNFNTNEGFSIGTDSEKHEFDINETYKFNDWSGYFNPENYTYSYICPIYTNGAWCDKIVLKDKNDNFKLVMYINKQSGLVMKIEKIKEKNKDVETYNYQMNIVTDEQIKKILDK